jgi:hypothetical protein
LLLLLLLLLLLSPLLVGRLEVPDLLGASLRSRGTLIVDDDD